MVIARKVCGQLILCRLMKGKCTVNVSICANVCTNCTCVNNLHMCAHMSVHSVGNCAGSPACSYGGWRKPPYAPIFLWRRPPTVSVGGGIFSFLKVSCNIYLSSSYMLIRQYWERKSVQNALIISSVSCFILHLTRRFPIPSNPIHFVAYAATSVFDSVI